MWNNYHETQRREFSQINRNFYVKCCNLTDNDRAFVRLVKDWLYSFANDIESEYEEVDSMLKLKAYVSSDAVKKDVSPHIISFTYTYIVRSFEPQLPHLCKRHFMSKWCHHVGDNNFTETTNSMLSSDVLGPKPRDGIDLASHKTIEHTQRTHLLRARMAHVVLNRSFGPRMDREETELEVAIRKLSQQIHPKPLQRASDEHVASTNYRVAVHPIEREALGSSRQFAVKYSGESRKTAKYHPNYRRTRVVTVTEVQVDGKPFTCFRCSCAFFLSRQVTCRHVFCLLKRVPSRWDFHPMCYKTYETHFGVKDDYTVAVSKMLVTYTLHRGTLIPVSPERISYRGVEINRSVGDFYDITCEESVDVNQNTLSLLNAGALSKLSELVVTKPKKDPQRAELYQWHVQLSALVVNPRTRNIFLDAMQRCHTELIAEHSRGAQVQTHPGASSGAQDEDTGTNKRKSIASLPSLDTKKQHRRFAPASSPRGKRKNV